MNIDLRLGDCLQVLKTIPDNSIDSVVTDPPYGLSFMGKKWDYDVPSVEVWTECLRVLKPGGHLLSFAGSRTYHRMAVRIEDAGFEIRDQIMWVYGSGFPKSHNIGKAIDKIAGRVDMSCDEVKIKLKGLYDKSGKSLSKISEECGFNASGYIKIESNKPDPWTTTLPTVEKWKVISKVINATEEEKDEISNLLQSAEREVIGTKSSGLFNGGEGNSVGGTIVAEVDITIANIEEAKEWEGWGTALKPAHEPIVMARKPLAEKSINNMNIDLRLGDCLEVLKTIPDNSIDSVVTDPPYHLTSIVKRFGKEDSAPAQFGTDGAYARASKGFMGKEWDGGDIAFRTDVWEECLRILKPGGHLLAFSHSRTYHRMAVAVEDAGFEIRDQILWIYGSGFPKSHNIGKAIDKRKVPCDVKEFGELCKIKREELGITVGKADKLINGGTGNYRIWIEGQHHKSGEPQRLPRWNEYLEIKKLFNLDDEWDECMMEAEREIVGYKDYTAPDFKKEGIMFGDYSKDKRINLPETISYRDDAKEWEGWGTALKPAHEPIVMARKPLAEKSIAENVLKYGTGGINIDGSRIPFEDTQNAATNPKFRKENNYKMPELGQESNGAVSFTSSKNEYDTSGRFPANIIFDEEAGQLLDEQSGKLNKQGKCKTDNKSGWQDEYVGGKEVKAVERKLYLDTGGASRFFYCPKAAKSDRNEGLDGFEKKTSAWMSPDSRTNKENYDRTSPGLERFKPEPRANNHPTVKPTDLMRYLINLITPPNGTILDPFMGSGSTGKAAVRCGVNFIGIEKEQEYMDIASARIEHEKNKPVQAKLFDK